MKYSQLMTVRRNVIQLKIIMMAKFASCFYIEVMDVDAAVSNKALNMLGHDLNKHPLKLNNKANNAATSCDISRNLSLNFANGSNPG